MVRKKTPTDTAPVPVGPPSFDAAASVVRAWDINNRINAYLIENLADGAWRAEPPGRKGRVGR